MFTNACSKDDDNQIPDNDPPKITVTDIDGNVYNTVTIGTQTWTAENLKTTRYNDGTAIPLVTDSIGWYINTDAYCWYDNDEATYGNTYGALYNWHTVSSTKLCPTGWHAPSENEWTTLADYISGDGHTDAVGKSLKATTIWQIGEAGTDDYGFSAVPSGSRLWSGEFRNSGIIAHWWSTDEGVSEVSGYSCTIFDIGDRLYRSRTAGKSNGFSIRCIKD